MRVLRSRISRAFAKSAGGKRRAGPVGERFPAAKDARLECRRKPARRLAEFAFEELDDRFRERDLPLRVEYLLGSEVVREHEESHVADDFRSRSDFHDVAEELVHLGIHPADFVPAFADSQRVGLLIEVRVLPAGHLVEIDFGGTRKLTRLEWRVVLSHVFPVIRRLLQGLEVDTRCRGR